MVVISECIKVLDRTMTVNLPKKLDFEEVEVVIMPKNMSASKILSNENMQNIGKIGFDSSSFEDDNEDYSQW